MPITHYDSSYDLREERLECLREMFPEAFADGGLDWDALRDLLGAPLEEGDEYNTYGLFWPGKRAARRAAALPPRDALTPAPGEGVDEDTTRNVFIEGDNLEVLKLLRKAYAGRVKMIYIDPPYNTGNDLVYQDDFSESEKDYLWRTGQSDDLERRLTSNTKANGRFHANWLDMMYPRLTIARLMLVDDGVILVSADDNEVHALRHLLSEVFGDENFIAIFTWETKRAARGVPPRNLLMENHEYLVCYARDASRVVFRGLDRDEADFGNPDGDPRGLWRSESMRATGNQNNYFDIVDPDTGRAFHGNWAFSRGRVAEMIQQSLVIFPSEPDGVPRQKKFMDSYTNETKAGVTALGWHSTERSTQEVMDLFDGRKVFDFPKPLSLIGYLCNQVLTESGLVVDFFAGSCTTAQAVLMHNRVHMAGANFLMVQLPETVDVNRPTGKAASELGLPTISEIGKERIRRVIARMKAEGVDPQREAPEDLGFRVFKQGPSNYRRWRDYIGQSANEYQEQLAGFASPLVEGWDPIGLRTEVMLAQGFPLDSRIARSTTLPHNTVDVISHEWCEHRLWICLDERLAPETVEALPTPASGYGPQDVFVCLDSALSDEARARLDDRCNVVII